MPPRRFVSSSRASSLLKRLGMPVSADAAVSLAPKNFCETFRLRFVTTVSTRAQPTDTEAKNSRCDWAFQRSFGLAETGEPSRGLLQLIRIQ